MKPRAGLILALTLGLLAAPLAAEAQPAGRVYRIAILGNVPLTDAEGARLSGALSQGLRELGYLEGQSIIVEHRSSEGQYERLPALAAELVRWKPDVIVVPNASNALAARDATHAIAPEIVGKQLELLKEIVPRVTRVAMLWNPINRAAPLFLDQARGAVRTLGLRLQSVQARQPEDIESAFTTMSRERAGALLVLADAMFILQRRRIAELAAKHHLPAMYTRREHMEAGGLAFYGPSMVDNFLRAAVYVDKILKGAKPGNLPVEQPTKFETGHQRHDREGPRPDHPAVAPAAGGRDDSVVNRRRAKPAQVADQGELDFTRPQTPTKPARLPVDIERQRASPSLAEDSERELATRCGSP